MPWTSLGVFTLTQDFEADRDLGPPDSLIDATKFMTELNNIKAGLEATLHRSGYNAVAADVSWGGNKITSLKDATAAQDAMNARMVAKQASIWGTIGGTANALTVTNAMSATMAAGVRVSGLATATNTSSSCTLALNGAAATTIKRANGDALGAGDIKSGRVVHFEHDGTYWRLVSPIGLSVRGDEIYLTSGSASASEGTPNVHTATVSNIDFVALTAGQVFLYIPHRTNTGTLTLGLNGGTAYEVRDFRAQAYASGDVLSDSALILYFDGTYFRVVGGSGGGSSAATLAGLTDVDLLTSPDRGVLYYNSDTELFTLEALDLTGYATTSSLSSYATTSSVTSSLALKLDASAATAFGLSLIDDADNAAARATLGLGSMATETTATWQGYIDGLNTALTTKIDTSAATSLGLDLISSANEAAARTALGLGTAATLSPTAYALTLLDDADASAARTTLGLGDFATTSQATFTAAFLAAQHAFTAAQGFTEATLTDAATIAWNLDTGQCAKVTLGGNRTLGAPSNMRAGFTYVLRVIQDGTGGRTLTFNSTYKFPGGIDPVMSTTAGSVSLVSFYCDGTNMYGVGQVGFA